MTSKLWNELSDQEQKAYIIGFDAGKQKGVMKGFAIGAVVGMVVTIVTIAFIL